MVDLDNRWWTVLFGAWGANLINRRCTFHLLGLVFDLDPLSFLCVRDVGHSPYGNSLFWFIVNKMNVGPITTITSFSCCLVLGVFYSPVVDRS